MLKAKNYKPFPKVKKESVENDEEDSSAVGGFDYLLSMPLWSLTMEKVRQLEAEKELKESELNNLLKKSPQNLWETDLEQLLLALDQQEGIEKADLAVAPKARGKARAVPASKKPVEPKKSKDPGYPEKPLKAVPAPTKQKTISSIFAPKEPAKSLPVAVTTADSV